MPADFDKCVKDGGKVITKELPKNKYIHICYDKDGNSHSGEVLTKQKKKSTLELLDFIDEVIEDLKT